MDNKTKDWNIVDILSHSRHDWLNKLQLIKGNLSLQKYDRVNDILEEVIIEAQQESKLCNLKMLDFAGFLMTFNWGQHHFSLEYEILGDIKSLEGYDSSITRWTRGFLDILDNTVNFSSDNHLSITIELGEDEKEVRFFFDFKGIIMDKDQLIEWLKTKNDTDIYVDEFQINTYELTTTISLGS